MILVLGSNYGNDDMIDNEALMTSFELHDTLKKQLLQVLESFNNVDSNDDDDNNKDACAFFFDSTPSRVQQTSAIRTIFFKSFSQSLAYIIGIIIIIHHSSSSSFIIHHSSLYVTGIFKEFITTSNIFESFLKNAIIKSVISTATTDAPKKDQLTYLSYLLIDVSSQNMHLLSRTHLMSLLSLTASRYYHLSLLLFLSSLSLLSLLLLPSLLLVFHH